MTTGQAAGLAVTITLTSDQLARVPGMPPTGVALPLTPAQIAQIREQVAAGGGRRRVKRVWVRRRSGWSW